MIRFIVGAGAALLALLAAYILEGGIPVALVSFSGFLITFFLPFFGVLAVWKFRDWTRAWRHAFKTGEKGESRVSVEVWKFSEFVCYVSGFLGFVVGLILILGSVDWTQAVPISRSFAAALIAPLYGTTFGFVCRILRARVESLNP